jgi:hypothetical protein
MHSIPVTPHISGSSLLGLDLPLLRQLCEFHRWPMTRLCETTGLEKSVLSNVLAGRRPLPKRIAAEFLSRVGMLPDGTLNSNHCFVFDQRVGREDELSGLVHKLFPNGGAFVDLANQWINRGNAKNPDPRAGKALWDGLFTAVIRFDKSQYSDDVKLRSDWTFMGLDDSAENFLSDDILPNRSDVLEAFAATDFVPPISWLDVQNYAKQQGLSPTVVLDILVGSVSQQNGGTKLL